MSRIITLTCIFIGVGIHHVSGQAINRKGENSLHNAAVVGAPTVTPKDSIRKTFGDKLLFEFVGGPSMCFFTGDDGPDQIPFHRYALALAAVHRATKTFGLEAKILWEPKGILLKYRSANYSPEELLYKQGLKLDYLTLALTANYYIDCERRLYIGAGASVGMLIRQWTFTYTYDSDGKKVSSYSAKTDPYRKFEMGLIANVGYRRHVWKNMLVNVQVFGNFGLTDVTKKFDPDPYPTNRNANLALLIGIGIGRK